MIGLCLAAIVALIVFVAADERAGKPRLTVVVPADYCGQMAIYFAHDPDGAVPVTQWERALTLSQSDSAILARVPFPDDAMKVSFVGALEGNATRIDRISVGSWPYGAVYLVLVGHEDCPSPSLRSHEQNQTDQIAFEQQIQG